MRYLAVISILLIGLVCLPTNAMSALGDAYTLKGGVYRNDKPLQETLQFGDVKNILQRNSIYIPASYGKLIGMTPNAERAVFWFEDDNGAIRNVVLPSEELTLIERKGSATVTRY